MYQSICGLQPPGAAGEASSVAQWPVSDAQSGNCAGQVTEGDKGGFDVLRANGTVWLKPDAVFWVKMIGAGLSKTMAGKYLKGNGDDAAVKGMSSFCDMGLEALKTWARRKTVATTRPVRSRAVPSRSVR
ncbi:hypothetical protein KCMC57_up53360 [Kitasatospora sp. CMC57]|uniref:Uncharacterized protein n=1 Tax=Kitasatospora sp. CMC57 TaxID=3231513 RepID=A0AB33KC40_9ACTN